MIKKTINNLPELEKKILRFHILAIHSITIGLSTDITFPNTHPTDIKNAVFNLVQYGYFKETPPQAVVFTDDGYYECQIYFKSQLKRKRILIAIKTPFVSYRKPIGKVFVAVISGIILYIAYPFIDKYILNRHRPNKGSTQQAAQQLKAQEPATDIQNPK